MNVPLPLLPDFAPPLFFFGLLANESPEDFLMCLYLLFEAEKLDCLNFLFFIFFDVECAYIFLFDLNSGFLEVLILGPFLDFLVKASLNELPVIPFALAEGGFFFDLFWAYVDTDNKLNSTINNILKYLFKSI